MIALIAALFTINPIWNYGPYDPSPVSAGTQPDWYIGFADGALRLIPPGWEFVWLDRTWSFNILVPLIAHRHLPRCSCDRYPFIEAWVTGDKREHHIADRPRNAPTRTAIGAAGVTFYAGLWAAASSDILATHFSLTMEGVIHALQAVVIIGPFVAYFIAKRVCIALQKKDREIVLHGYESGRIVKLPGGEFIEVHQPLDEYDRWRLVSFDELRAAHDPPERARQDHRRPATPRRHVAVVLRGPHRAGHEGRARGVALHAPLSRPLTDSGTGPMSIDTTWLRCPNCLLPLETRRGTGARLRRRAPLRRLQARHGHPAAAEGAENDRRRPGDAGRSCIVARQRRLRADRDGDSRCSAGEPDRPRWATVRIADLGCGTGHYSAQLSRSIPGLEFLLGDRSPDAVRMSRRALDGATGVVLDIWRPLPIRDAVADVVLNVFAPRNAPEFGRILRPGGRVVVVVPTTDHLRELRAEGVMLDVPPEKAERVSAQFAEAGFERRSRTSVEYPLDATETTQASLIDMGPAAHHPTHRVAADDITTRQLTVSVDLLVFTLRSPAH